MNDHTLTLGEIAQKIGARLDHEADTHVAVQGVGSLHLAAINTLSFAVQGTPVATIDQSKASAIIVQASLAKEINRSSKKLLISDNPYAAFAKAAALFYQQPHAAVDGLAQSQVQSPINDSVVIGAFSVVGAGVVIGNNTQIGPQCWIGDGVKIGKDCLIYAGVKIYPHTEIGDRAIIHSGVVLGADGFGFAPESRANADGCPSQHWVKFPQMATVIIGNDVEIGANSTVDRGALSPTRIGDGVKIDNLVQIGHGTHIGARSIIAAQAGVAGSTTIGEQCRIAGHTGIANGLVIASGVVIHPKACVEQDILEAGEYSGVWPLQKHKTWLRSQAIVKKIIEYKRLWTK